MQTTTLFGADIAHDLLLYIFDFLDANNELHVKRRVNKQWNQLILAYFPRVTFVNFLVYENVQDLATIFTSATIVACKATLLNRIPTHVKQIHVFTNDYSHIHANIPSHALLHFWPKSNVPSNATIASAMQLNDPKQLAKQLELYIGLF